MDGNRSISMPGRGRTLSAHGLGGLRLEIADLAAAGRFVEAMGLSYRGDAQAGTVHLAGSADACLQFTRGSRTRLRELRLGCFAADLPALAQRAAQLGHEPVRLAQDGFVLKGPDGIVSVFAASAPQPRPTGALVLPRVSSRRETPLPSPASLSHAAIFTADLPGALRFYTDVVGFRLSDRCANDLAFLHSPHGSGHHVLALVQSSAGGLHHHSWEMGTVDAIGLRAAYLAEQGYDRGWGLGRHVLGSNFFHYVRDPWGSHAELTAGLEYIEAGQKWTAADHPAEDAFYLWGPPPPQGFIDNAEAKSLQATA